MRFLFFGFMILSLNACQPSTEIVTVEQRRDQQNQQDQQPIVVQKTTNQDLKVTPKDEFSDAIQAVVRGAPAGESSDLIVSLEVSGAGIVQFLYKYGISDETDCAVESGYIIQRNASAPISIDFSGLEGGDVLVCVIGGTISNVWQPYSSATKVSWTQTAPVEEDSQENAGGVATTEIKVKRPAVLQADNPNYCYYVCMSSEYPADPNDAFGYIRAGVIDDQDHSCLVPDARLGKYSQIACDWPR